SIHHATQKARSTELVPAPLAPLPSPAAPALDLGFAQIARQRRSAVDFDGRTHITAEAFYAMLDCLLRRADTPPWNALTAPALLHPALMVHRIDGLEPGLYMFVRDAAALPRLQESMRPE